MHTDPASAATLAYVTQTAPVLALGLDERQCVTSANAYAARILGGDTMGRPLSKLVVSFTPAPDLRAPDATDEAGHLLSLNTSAGLPETIRFRFFKQPHGWLALGSLDFEQQARLQTEVLELNRDLNNLSRKLHQANAELSELNQLKNRFLGMAAHDLRKPIGVIMTYGEFVFDEAGETLSQEHRGFLRTCLDSAIGMKRLIDSFLDVAIIESGTLRLELASSSVSEILAGVEPLARMMAERKNIDLLSDKAREADGERRIRVDASKIQQVLLNLLGNAVEHSLPGQSVSLSSCWDERNLVFRVRDEGTGIAPEDQAQLFAAFARAGTRKTAGERSVGLGLAIARLIVEAHGGQIRVESAPGRGATFCVALPVQSNTESIQLQAETT